MKETREIMVIIGLPGSGKTHYLEALPDEWAKVDDIEDIKGFPANEERVAVCSPHFCKEEILERAMAQMREAFPQAVISKVYFENDPERCQRNAETRKEKRVKDFIEILSRNYKPPTNALPVWHPVNDLTPNS